MIVVQNAIQIELLIVEARFLIIYIIVVHQIQIVRMMALWQSNDAIARLSCY